MQYCIFNNQTSTSAVRKQIEIYENAMQEKRGPKGKDGEHNWLWPLSHTGLQSIRDDEAKDAFAMTYMMEYSSKIIAKITEIIANKK